MQELAAGEARQSLEVLFALCGELLFLSISLRFLLSIFGILIVIIDIISHN